MSSRIIASILFLGGTAVVAQKNAWEQCGGINYAGDTTCASGYTCTFLNDYYSQCTPGSAGTTATTRTTTSTGSSTTLSTTTRTTTGGGSGTGTYPTTLQSGYYWVRAVEAPNFHSYLQAAPTATPSPSPGLAHLLSPKSAGQFNIVDGQLVYYTPGGTLLYMWVENPTDKTQRKLETGFGTEKNTYGTFAFQGDTVTWSVGDIKRPNTAAWLVCGDGGQLYINTGAYAYDTPQGCADETIHSYGGSTADA